MQERCKFINNKILQFHVTANQMYEQCVTTKQTFQYHDIAKDLSHTLNNLSVLCNNKTYFLVLRNNKTNFSVLFNNKTSFSVLCNN